MNESAPVILFGEGSASIFLLQELVKRNEKILWIAGSGARLLPVMPSVKSPLALATLIKGRSALLVDPGCDPAIEQGLGHGVYRNKA